MGRREIEWVRAYCQLPGCKGWKLVAQAYLIRYPNSYCSKGHAITHRHMKRRLEKAAAPKVVPKKAAPVKEVIREAVITDPQCVHHWIIDQPNGSVSKGRCKKCGSTRDFSNYWRLDSHIVRKSARQKEARWGYND